MHFSERAIIDFKTGVMFRTQSLRSVAIYDGSQCWGLWVPLFRGDDEICQSPADPLTRHHLAISPFHPVSWPFLLRINIHLQNRKGALEEAAKLLMDLDLNILHQEQAVVGFDHAVWSVVAEALDVRRAKQGSKEDFDKKYPWPRGSSLDQDGSGRQTKDLRVLSQDISRAMILKCSKVRGKFEDLSNEIREAAERKQPSSGFLYDRTAMGRQYLFDFSSDSKKNADLDVEAAKHAPASFEVDWLKNMAFFAIFGGGVDAPFGMKYDEKFRKVKFALPVSHPEMDRFDLSRPNASVVAFNTHEKYVRILPICGDERARSMALVDLHYQAKSLTDASSGYSKGVLNSVASTLRRNNFDVVTIMNRVYRFDYRSESGSLRILGRFSPSPLNLKSAKKKLAAELRNIVVDGALRSVDDGDANARGPTIKKKTGANSPVNSRVEIPHVQVEEIPIGRIFVSLKFGHPRNENIQKILTEVAARVGLEVDFSLTYVDAATEEVRSKLSLCQGLLQILTPPLETTEDRGFMWLDFEYGVAVGLKIPRIRLVDISLKRYDWWNSRIGTDRDRHYKTFMMNVGDDQLRSVFLEALSEISHRIHSDY